MFCKELLESLNLGVFLVVCLFSGAGAWVRWTGFTVASCGSSNLYSGEYRLDLGSSTAACLVVR